MTEVGATGVAVALLSDGAVVYERFFGVKDISTKAPIDGDTVASRTACSMRPAGGFGWHSVASCHEERLTHGGFEPGYFANVVLFPKSRIGLGVGRRRSTVSRRHYANELSP